MKDLFGIDRRTLVFFRMSLATVVIHDLCLRMVDLQAHYSDLGIFPRATGLVYNEIERFSLHMSGGSFFWQSLLFGIHFAISLALFFGWQTKITSFLTWLFLLSLHTRNPIILGGGDTLIRQLAFWSIFLPLGEGFDFRPKERGQVEFSMASVGILLQVVFLYWFTVAMKNHSEWREEGTAIFYSLQIDQLTTPLGTYLLNFPQFLKFITKFVLFFEALGPIIAFFPWKNGPVRTGVVFSFLIFHCVVLALMMNLGIFPYACFLAWILFLPSWFWDHLPLNLSPVPNPNLGQEKSHFFLQGSLALLIVYVFLWNVRELDQDKWKWIIPAPLVSFGRTVGLDQNWALFAPYPYKDDGWFVFSGTLKNGEKVDAFQKILKSESKNVSWERPSQIYETFPNRRWAKYMRTIWYQHFEYLREPFSNYICRIWNVGSEEVEKDPMKKLEYFDMFYMEDVTPPFGTPSQPVERRLLWTQFCGV